ncbi:MAG: hypothetical protein Q7U91_11005 [Sideroxyarcus sp.]|nr:hypothetical protein [Sideroxyarcus sp.]
MSKPNIAIIGLGRVGSAFMGDMLLKKQNVNLVCVAEQADTPGKAKAKNEGIKIATLDEIVAKGDGIDVIFELTGITAVRQDLRTKLMAANNHHTVIASEMIARLIGSLINDGGLPVIEGRKTGY